MTWSRGTGSMSTDLANNADMSRGATSCGPKRASRNNKTHTNITLRQRRSRLRHAALAGPPTPRALPDVARHRVATLTAHIHNALEAGLSKPGGGEHHLELLARDPSLCRQRSKAHASSTSLPSELAPDMEDEDLPPFIQVFPTCEKPNQVGTSHSTAFRSITRPPLVQKREGQAEPSAARTSGHLSHSLGHGTLCKRRSFSSHATKHPLTPRAACDFSAQAGNAHPQHLCKLRTLHASSLQSKTSTSRSMASAVRPSESTRRSVRKMLEPSTTMKTTTATTARTPQLLHNEAVSAKTHDMTKRPRIRGLSTFRPVVPSLVRGELSLCAMV